MGKRLAGKKRGIAKYKIKSKALKPKEKRTVSAFGESLKVKENERTLLGLRESTYYSLGRTCFEFWFYWCGKLYLAPFTRTAEGEYVPLDRKSKIIHYCVWFVKFLILLHNLVGTGIILLREELKIETFMCTSHLLIYIVSFCVSLGMVAKPNETMDLLNGWPFIFSCLKELRGSTPCQYDDLSTSLKIIAVFVATQGIALAAALLSLAFSRLPTCLFPTAERFGLIPDGLLPRFGWQLVFFPLEYMMCLPPMFSSPLAISMLLMLVGSLKMVGQELRRIKVTDLDSRAKLEYLYVCNELFNRVCFVWIKFMLPPTVFSVSLTIIVTTFISIRYTELPIYYYVFFPNTAFTLMLIIFWLSYDGVLCIRASEDILSTLLSYEATYVRQMPRALRVQVLKRAKAMRVVEFPIGEFADFSINFPISIWDEVLNQVLFLLSF